MRRTTTLTALLLGATLVTPTGAASAAVETCRGETATIVGTGPTIHGTDGRDVIVTGKSDDVLAGAGDDLICVTGDGASSNVVTVDALAGNDVVDSTAMDAGFYLTAILGDGSDTFVGGPGGDSVVAGASALYTRPPSEGEPDVIDTGAGSDSVTSGGVGIPNADVVRLGTGNDDADWSGTMGPDGVLDGGDGSDQLISRASGQTFRVDLAQQRITRNGVAEAAFNSFEGLSVRPEPGVGTVEVIGTEAGDFVDVGGSVTVQADLRGGNDYLSLDGPRAGSRLDLGSGTDLLAASSFDGQIDLDLTEGAMVVDGAETSTVAGIEHAYVTARISTLTGNGVANRLSAIGCLSTIDGRGGRDDITHGNYDGDSDQGYDCDTSRVTLRGGPGNDDIEGGVRADRIYGGAGNDHIDTGSAREGINRAWGGPGRDALTGGGARDVLLGGPGRDRAAGGGGRDRCAAEVEKSCER